MVEEYRGMRVLITGHTGFKGSWLALWLRRKGTLIAGIDLPPELGRPSLFEKARVSEGLVSTFADIQEFANVERRMVDFQPKVVFHLAGQALVRRSYRNPINTFASNVMGTVHMLEATRRTPSVRATVFNYSIWFGSDLFLIIPSLAAVCVRVYLIKQRETGELEPSTCVLAGLICGLASPRN